MSSRGRRLVITLAALAGLCAALPQADAHAAPSIWTRARNPAIERRVQLLGQAEALLLKYRALQVRGRREVVMGRLYLGEALKVLEEGGAATSRDPILRFRLAEVHFELTNWTKAAPLYESVLRSRVSAPMRQRAYSELALCYARLDRHDDEIRAYTEALALQPIPSARATLLANRAEAYMYKGDLTSAIEGYRAALLLHTPGQLVSYAATTLWGLAVALDRSGDLEAGFASIQLARTYDKFDKQLSSGSWFYVPEYDVHWYKALGHWSSARATDLGAVRAEEIGRAVTAWEEFIENARPDDPWLPLARARLKMCVKERDRALEKARSASKPRPAPKGELEPLPFDVP